MSTNKAFSYAKCTGQNHVDLREYNVLACDSMTCLNNRLHFLKFHSDIIQLNLISDDVDRVNEKSVCLNQTNRLSAREVLLRLIKCVRCLEGYLQ